MNLPAVTQSLAFITEEYIPDLRQREVKFTTIILPDETSSHLLRLVEVSNGNVTAYSQRTLSQIYY